MNRRDFLRYLLATPIAAEFDIEKLLWVKEKTIFVSSVLPVSLYGIPYHQTNGSIGTWLGFERSLIPEIKSVYIPSSGRLDSEWIKKSLTLFQQNKKI